MNEKERILNQLQNLGVSKDILNEIEPINSNSVAPPEQIDKGSTYKKGLDYAVRILSLRDYSTHKITQKLKDRGIEKPDILKIIDQLNEWKYIREDEYTKQRIKQLIVKGYANKYIIQKIELEHLTVNNDEIDEIRSDQDYGEDSQIEYLIEKKLRSVTIPSDFNQKMKLKNKITRYLVSKGYGFSEINSALNQRFQKTISVD